MIKTVALVASLLLNICLAALLLFRLIDGCAEVADGRIGVLARDVEIGPFDSDTRLFRLPRGLPVRDASATGAGWFEPHRFRLIVTSDDPSLVVYDGSVPPLVPQQRELYSADVPRRP